MNEVPMLAVESGAPDGFPSIPFHQARRFTPQQNAWIDEQIARVREGQIRPERFKEMIVTRNFGGPVPFLREMMTVSDFPLTLIANVADRALLAAYNEAPSSWQQYTKLKINTDLKPAYLFAIDGGESPLEVVPPTDQYPEDKLVESQFTVTVKKFGRIFRFSLEAFLNDGLNAFDSIPARMGRAARRTQETLVTKAYATDTQIASIYSVANKNQIKIINGARVDNPPFSVDGIIDGIQVMANQVDADGQPINIEGVIVVYPSGLEATAMQIKRILEVRSTVRGGDSNNLLVMSNPIQDMVTFVPNHQLVVAGETNKKTGWFMFQNPNIGRPAIVAAQLLGHQNPEMFVKSSNANLIGGGVADPMQGNFEDDSSAFKVRMWFGVANIDPKSTAYSNGTGS